MTILLHIDFVFNKINLNNVQISHKLINELPKIVIEKSDFIYEGTLRDYFYEDGRYSDRLYCSILNDEFMKINK